MLSSLVAKGVSLCLEYMVPPPELHIWDEKELCRSSRREAKQPPFAQVEALAIFSGLARPYVWGVLCQVGAGSLVIDSGQPSLQADIW